MTTPLPATARRPRRAGRPNRESFAAARSRRRRSSRAGFRSCGGFLFCAPAVGRQIGTSTVVAQPTSPSTKKARPTVPSTAGTRERPQRWTAPTIGASTNDSRTASTSGNRTGLAAYRTNPERTSPSRKRSNDQADLDSAALDFMLPALRPIPSQPDVTVGNSTLKPSPPLPGEVANRKGCQAGRVRARCRRRRLQSSPPDVRRIPAPRSRRRLPRRRRPPAVDFLRQPPHALLDLARPQPAEQLQQPLGAEQLAGRNPSLRSRRLNTDRLDRPDRAGLPARRNPRQFRSACLCLPTATAPARRNTHGSRVSGRDVAQPPAPTVEHRVKEREKLFGRIVPGEPVAHARPLPPAPRAAAGRRPRFPAKRSPHCRLATGCASPRPPAAKRPPRARLRRAHTERRGRCRAARC